MNITLYIIRKLLSKEAFYKYRKYIKVKEPRELVMMYECLDKQMEQLQRDISLTEYALFVNQQDPSLCSLTEQLLQDDVGEDSLQQMLQIHVDRQWAYDVALKAVAVHEGREEVNALTALTQDAPALEDVLEEDYFYEGTSKEVLQGIDRRTGGLRWRLRQLDSSLGGLQRGDFGFIFARSETGKTTFLVSEISHFATQTEAPVIWFNNEESREKVKGRMIQGALGITTEQFVKWEERAWDKFNDTHSNFKLRDATPMHKNDIEAAMERYRPALVVIDQLDKIKGFKADREDVMFGAIYCWARELAKKYCPVIGVCQAAASAENKKWLTMDDIAKSKTEKPAEADFIIGIGKTHTVGEEDIRYLHLVKNKLTGIHAKITCMIQADIARYKDI